MERKFIMYSPEAFVEVCVSTKCQWFQWHACLNLITGKHTSVILCLTASITAVSGLDSCVCMANLHVNQGQSNSLELCKLLLNLLVIEKCALQEIQQIVE